MRIVRLLLAPSLFLLTGCGEYSLKPPEAEMEDRSAPVPHAAVPAGSVPLTRIGDLVGEYRVAGIDDAQITGDRGIALSIDGNQVSFEPTCAGFVWRIEQHDGALRFVRVPQYPPAVAGAPPPPVCAVAVSPQLRQLGEAIDAGSRAWRTAANGILIEGGGRSALLFSQ